MNEERSQESAVGERDAVSISRDYDFPRESVFKMVTDPATARKFFSPEGAVKLLFEWDPKPGGKIRIHDRYEGRVGQTSGTFTEFVAPERFAFRSTTKMGEGAIPFDALQSMTFEALGPTKTRVTVRVKVLSVGSFPGGVGELEQGFVGGWGQTLDMLQRELR